MTSITHATRTLAAVAASTLALSCLSVQANERPGQGVKVQPLKSSIAEETFQTLLVMKALEQLGYDEQFYRLWEFYLCYCEGGFLERSIGAAQLLLAKPGARPEPLLARGF